MVSGKGRVVIDFGNSQTRCSVLYGKDKTGKYHEKNFILSNRFALVDSNYTLPADYDEETSSILHCKAVVDGKAFESTIANGEVQLREFNTSPLRPSALEKKHKSVTTACSFQLAMLHAFKAVARLSRVSSLDVLDISWTVVALLPPGDFSEESRDEFTALIKSVESVKTNTVDLKINIDSVKILPEGFCAFIGCIFDRGQVIRPEQKYMLSETTLVFDIGAGTTDIMIIKDNRTINNTMYTIEKGGNNVTQTVKRELRRNGIVIQETELNDGIATGYIKDGAKTLDISKLIVKAKEELANALVSEAKGYFEDIQFPIRSIGRVLCCGGGAMSSTEGGTTAVSEGIVTFLKTLSPNIEMVEYPDKQVTKFNEDGTPYTEVVKISPRDLNIVGASILAEVMP